MGSTGLQDFGSLLSLEPDLSDFLESTLVAGVGGTSQGLSRRGCSLKLL